ncbi:LysR family transcriptional regulator [Priestia filamentosa]|nr:LysR family transcriptional regulator [Priestia filamentosa]MDT3764003.1 LysR family transcriptional regulator [Priestia filamentosa]OXS71521.1 LysR family transcriptional regulator [Priestia filamentosa]RJS67165.1 LysR family transcriptional regulator [Priestia filamentosa]WCM17883.1 LysR family transcriptional regulator [Priestia filamentosa]WRU97638.1 LysR family transcriptional regulator [Priestia filamentosa]
MAVDIRQLEYFVAVAEQESFTKAAANVHLSQPALSKIVKNLEEELKVELFDRSTRKLKLTDAGEIVYQEALKLTASLTDLTLRLDNLMNSPTGTIRIGIPPLIGTLFFPSIARSFHNQYPKISLELVEFGAKKLVEFVEEEKVDIAIIVLPVNNPKFEIYPFIQEEFAFFCAKTHKFANRTSLSLKELSEEKFILFSKQFTLHDRIIWECVNAGFTPSVPYESSQWDLISELVAEEFGIAILPQSIYSKMNHDKITMVPLVNPTPLWELGFAVKKNSYISFANRKLIDFLVSYSEDHKLIKKNQPT